MGRVSTKTVKKSAYFLFEKYNSSLTLDFQINKRFCDEMAIIPSKKLRNKIAGYVTHLSKKTQEQGFEKLHKENIQKKDIMSSTNLMQFTEKVKLVDVDEKIYEIFKYAVKSHLPFSVRFKSDDL
ncbi:40S ribosomal protein S17 (nucleomorph) [Cryptomonas paramecium]|uniref:40S ribosomal protein S17 n=1 Tax=Cryptomonas paramaecium TaxID=2898 RepID=F2HIB1_9CRYP|nr:40S ribosomal protein S17 [Cryptomonas paramecium]AEA39035.1 40S ribosomal protein S17 [Cryptomonas paramecium]|mmetsp:Transcript_52135/g.136263  ORF Transcript_52135/g.136263 Transcript_52135/m.136263 type:complete len:125 (-) Transcript_52135:3468-3842(-)